jgi:two-component system response regulator DesR
MEALTMERGAPLGLDVPGSEDHRLGVLVIASQELVCYGIRVMLGRPDWLRRFRVARTVECGTELAESDRPDVTLIDMNLADVSTEALCTELRRVNPEGRLVLMTTADHMPRRSVAGIGAHGYLGKGWSAREVAECVERVGRGLEPARGSRTLPLGLSGRQLEILQLLADGRTNDEIAVRLYLSRNTVKQHASAIYRKLDVRNRAGAIGVAQAMGLLS